jgi:hypothetical protein
VPADRERAAALESPFFFLPAGRWRLCVETVVQGRGGVGSTVVDADGRALAGGRCARMGRETPATTHALELEKSRAVQVVVGADGIDAHLRSGTVTVEEVRFP